MSIDVEGQVLAALCNSTHPAINALQIPLYRRELRTQWLSDGTAILQLDKRGFRRYKNKSKKSAAPPPPADIEGIRTALNQGLSPGLRVTQVTDCGRYLKILMGDAFYE